MQTDEVDEVIFGHARSATHDRNVARAISRLVGISPSIPAYTIDKADASALQAIVSGAQSILLGESDGALAGGVEALDTSRVARENGITDTDTFAERFAITREQIERFARESRQRAETCATGGALCARDRGCCDPRTGADDRRRRSGDDTVIDGGGWGRGGRAGFGPMGRSIAVSRRLPRSGDGPVPASIRPAEAARCPRWRN